jgi:hypothetical protein
VACAAGLAQTAAELDQIEPAPTAVERPGAQPVGEQAAAGLVAVVRLLAGARVVAVAPRPSAPGAVVVGVSAWPVIRRTVPWVLGTSGIG